jgi:hypothetical protein
MFEVIGMIGRLLLATTLAIAAGPAAAQAPLKLPSTQKEMRELLREAPDPNCARCGVVTSVRQIPGGGAGAASPPGGSAQPGSSSLDAGVGAVPMIGQGARAERDALRSEAPGRFEVVVRYDDGSYGRVELPSDPRLRPGDRVMLDGGHIERQP